MNELLTHVTNLVSPMFESLDYLMSNFLALPEVFGLGIGYWFLLFLGVGIIFRGIFDG